MTGTGEQALAGRVAVVTGASRRIGRATALGLARHGADVVVSARSQREEVEAVAREIEALGGRARVAMGDVSKEDDVARMVAAASDAFGRIDILVNNAAIRRHAPLTQMSLEEWREIHGVILDGTFLMCRAVLPLMVGNGFGVIVNLGGVTAHIGAKNRAHVCSAKAGLVGLTKAIAVEFAEHGITANCLVPGKIGGERSATSGASATEISDVILKREGEVDEAAGMIVALCLPPARFMTGQTVHVSGGLYLP